MNNNNTNNTASLIGISRLRIGTDGHGITTLVAFHGCPLRCRYCLNPECSYSTEKSRIMSAQDVMTVLRKDEFYFVATKGGVTFGGGEPLLKSQFIKEIMELGAKEWNVTVETSLNVPQEHLELLMPYIDEYIVDIKDMTPEIYKKYTGLSNEQVKTNLRWLIESGKEKQILCRIPLIPGFNDEQSQEQSMEELSNMGFERFERFTYKTDIYEGKR